jgi:Ca2+-binding EF-hand superfamily protein
MTKEIILDGIPKQCIEGFVKELDKDLDDKISLQELVEYVKSMHVTDMTEEIAKSMFNEIATKRNVKHPSQQMAPLTVEEIMFASRNINSQL